MSELRENPITGEWVVIAPERAHRIEPVPPGAPRSGVPAFDPACPFCPGNEAETEEKFRLCGPDGKWVIRSVTNKFSVLSPEGDPERPHSPHPGERRVNGVGLHEVLVESPAHDGIMALYSLAHMRAVLEAYRNRFLDFYADQRVRHVILFKNYGPEAGASQLHPHSQIVGIPIVPGQVADRLARSRKFFEESGNCLACAVVASELAQARRVVAENPSYVAFVPHAALSPYHVWIFPKDHLPCFAEGLRTDALAEILHAVIAKLHGLLGNPSSNLVLRSLGPGDENSLHFHWYIAIVPRVNKMAGFELGTGIYINPSAPESSAEELRDYRPR